MPWIIARSKLEFPWNKIFKYTHFVLWCVLVWCCGDRFLPNSPMLHCWQLVSLTTGPVLVKLVNIYKITWCESVMKWWHNQNEITLSFCSFLNTRIAVTWTVIIRPVVGCRDMCQALEKMHERDFHRYSHKIFMNLVYWAFIVKEVYL